MAADVLSDVLKTVRLTGATYFDVAASAPWAAEQPTREQVLPKILPGAERLISYHAVTEGECWASMVGGEGRRLVEGDIIVFTRGDPHVLSSAPGMRAEPVAPADFDAVAAGPLPFFKTVGGSGAPTARLVCGFLACDARPFNPLLDQLPAIITTSWRESGPSWLGQFIMLARAESGSRRAGAESVLAKLSELLFIETLRRYIESLPAGQTGWLAGLRDPGVGKALSVLHARPARDWTIEELAREVAMSRSVLAERFNHLVGLPPMQYLAAWRMQLAAGLLNGGGNVASVAAEVGYASEAGFSRAFKKIVGVPPSAWRG
ncbi:MAG TPA: AraC family transcriptional regulator [Reyranella sp.]|nr:AraC family transcriptional regulator [Reyranella sp.]